MSDLVTRLRDWRSGGLCAEPLDSLLREAADSIEGWEKTAADENARTTVAADGWRAVYSNYWRRQVGGTFKTEAEAEVWIGRYGGDGPWKVEPFYFDHVTDPPDPDKAEHVRRLRFIADEYETAWHGRDVTEAVADLRAAADHIERCAVRTFAQHKEDK